MTGVTLDASGEFVTETIPYPDAAAATPEATVADGAATPEAADAPRTGTLAAHDDSAVVVGNYGDGLVLIDPDAGTMRALDLPATPLAFQFNDAGDEVVVLTDDGNVHGIDPVDGEVAWSTGSVTPYAEVQTDDGFNLYPSITIADEFAYIPDPGSGEVVAIDTGTGEIVDRYEVGGSPARVVAVAAGGVAH